MSKWTDLPADLRLVAKMQLTTKQYDVLRLWMNGYGTTRISVMLGVSEPTARAHLRRALQKLHSYMEEAA